MLSLKTEVPVTSASAWTLRSSTRANPVLVSELYRDRFADGGPHIGRAWRAGHGGERGDLRHRGATCRIGTTHARQRPTLSKSISNMVKRIENNCF